MNARLLKGVCVFVLLVINVSAGPRDAPWKAVLEATNQGLPKTAIERLEPIIAGALADKAYAEAVKAIAQKVALEGSIQGNKSEERIIRLQAELEKAPAAIKPVLEALLARWYWQYFQQHRWDYGQRTKTEAAPGPDIRTWDLARILVETEKHFVAALADEKTLKATPVTAYDDLLMEGNVPEKYRPTMYDFLANEALHFYQAGEHAQNEAEDAFEIPADSPIFDDVGEFIKWKPNTTDKGSAKLKAVLLLQDLLRFHRTDSDHSAFYDLDLARLSYGKNVASDEQKIERYKAALGRFIKITAKHETSARAIALLAAQINAEGDPAKAHALAESGLKKFPVSIGAAQCSNLIHQIEAKTVQMITERVWCGPQAAVNITYRNVTKIHFRAIPVDFGEYVAGTRWDYGSVQPEQLKAKLSTKPVLEWTAELPPTNDFKPRTEKLAAPSGLKPGFYFIVASHDSDFRVGNNHLSAGAVRVSNLALVLQSSAGTRDPVGFVLHAGSGEPIAGAAVSFWQRKDGKLEAKGTTQSDQDGRFKIPVEKEALFVMAEFEGQMITSASDVSYSSDSREDDDHAKTEFFTDRSIYRPGQTINYKGISIHYDHDVSRYETIADHSVTVVFKDTNGKEIARAEHRTNDYGSFSGVFTAPRDRLPGRMSIITLEGDGGAVINVEEYKRPKFQVELTAPVEGAKLDLPLMLTGKATAFTGAAINGAKVKWRVMRSSQGPSWCWWWRPTPHKTIAHGVATTEEDGTFKIQFTAAPDRSVPIANEPVFTYEVYADVTDTTGETRSDSRPVHAGYTALQASLGARDWQISGQPVELSIATNSLDGRPQSVNGTMRIHALKQPVSVAVGKLPNEHYWRGGSTGESVIDPANPDSWEAGALVSESSFATDASGATQLKVPLKAGIYRASLETQDRFGKKVTARHTVRVVDPAGSKFGLKLANYFEGPKWTLEPGETFSALWGTGYDRGRAFVEFDCNGKTLKSFWTSGECTQELVSLPISEEMRGGFTVRVLYVRENCAYVSEQVVRVPWSNKQLSVKWEHFRSKLSPGQKETWSAIITGADSKRVAAEMVATLYDASLDQYAVTEWAASFEVFREEASRARMEFQNGALFLYPTSNWVAPKQRDTNWSYRSFPYEILADLWGRGYLQMRAARSSMASSDELMVLAPFETKAAPEGAYAAASIAGTKFKDKARDEATPTKPTAEAVAETVPHLSKVTARKNLNETAFFFPQLVAGEDGTVRMTFTMPEALTEWKFIGFAHDQQLRSGFLTDKVTTSKDLMVEPNPPRFVREGDAIEFTVKVSNQSDQPQAGTVKLTFADAATLTPVDDALANRATEQPFDVPAKQSRSYSWRIAVPDGLSFLTYKAVAATTQFSDGEEGFLPVLSRRILVTESLPLPIRGKSTKPFEFKKLLASGSSDTLRHQSLTVQMTSQPAWYAVMALPYLMEYPYECSEQIFNRFYANALARHIANSDPKIRRVFDLWKATPALDSPLEKNQDLKSVMLEETPWLREAKAESEARRNVGLLFDGNRLDEETTRTLAKLAERQGSDGLWSWFPGGRSSEYISLYIATGFCRLRQLGVAIDTAPAAKAFGALDAAMDKDYRQILKGDHPEDYVPDYSDALYLYGRSFFLKDRPIASQHQEAVDFFLRQARKFWFKLSSRQSQAHLALALNRFGDKETPQAIMKSLKERSVSNEELGMFWRDTELSWWWYDAPIETQALMIEAFAEVANDTQAVEDCKVWLLKQKQTQDWKTTKATADAVYGLLLRGNNLLASDALVEVSLAGETIKPENVEAGTGFYEQKLTRDEIKPAMGQITVKKIDDGVSWGSVHWQYLEDMAKVTPHEGTPLKLKKTLWIKETTSKGQVLKPVTGSVAVGDELVVRIELRTDRDMEFAHLKDQRGSGTEPVNVLSQYKYQDGLGYYESTRDTASHFFIDYLPKGIYVFEYSTRVQLKGAYQTGIAEIQCMYAPEYNSHSESIALEVK